MIFPLPLWMMDIVTSLMRFGSSLRQHVCIVPRHCRLASQRLTGCQQQGPCKHGQRFGFDTDLLKAACVSLEEAGLLRPKSYVYEYMFLPASSDEQYKHYQLSYMIVNGTTWGLEVKGIEESNRVKREASDQSRTSLDKEEIPILDTRDFSQKGIQTHNINPTETSSEQYHRRSKYRQRYANARKLIHSFMDKNGNISSTGVRNNNNWSRKQSSRTTNNEPQKNDRFSNRRLSMIRLSGKNTFRHYDSLRRIQDNSTSSLNISTVPKQNLDRSRAPENTRKKHESFSDIQQFRRLHSKNIHRPRQPRNYQINIDAENDQMKMNNIQERFNSKHNITIPKFNNSQNFPLKGNKTEEKTKEKHKIRHEKHKKTNVEDIHSLVNTTLHKSENTTPIVKERKEKLFNHTSNGNSDLVFNSTFGHPRDANIFNKSYHGSIKSSEKEMKQSQKIKGPNNNRSKINQQKILKKRRRKGNRKKKHPVKDIEDLAGSTKFNNQIIKVNQNVKPPIEVKQYTESSSIEKKKRKRYRKRRKNKETNSKPLRHRERKSKQRRRRKKIHNDTKNGTVVSKRRKRKNKQSKISKIDTKFISNANEMLNNTTHSKNRSEENKQKVEKNSSESRDLNSKNKNRVTNKRKKINLNINRKNEKSKQRSTGLDRKKSESKEDSESSESSLPNYLSNKGNQKRRQTLSTGGGVIMTPLLSACKPGAKRDYNYKCRPKFIPQERKSQRRGDQPSESNVDPIPPRIKCPKGTRLDPRGKCQETSSSLG